MKPYQEKARDLHARDTAGKDEDMHREWMRLKGAPGWVSNGYVAVLLDSEEGFTFSKREPDPSELFSKCVERVPAKEIKALFFPTTRRTERKLEVVEYGCSGCDCGTCDGEPDKKEYRDVTTVECGQSVFRDINGSSFLFDPDYAALTEGLRTSIADGGGWHMLCGHDGDRLVVIVMGRAGEILSRHHARKRRAAVQESEAPDGR